MTAVTSFEPKRSYADLSRDAEADERLSSQLRYGQLGPDARYLALAATSALVVLDSKTVCTHLKARCRRYSFLLNRSSSWVGSLVPAGPSLPTKSVLEPIAIAAGFAPEMAIEDMCPFSREAMVESAINTRAGGAEPGVRKYGLKNNASLKDALRSLVRESKQ